MFESALETAGGFTFPYVGLRRKHDGTVFSTLGAFMVVNSQGWCITAAHLMAEIVQAKQSARSVIDLDKRIDELKNHEGKLSNKQRHELHGLEDQRKNYLSHSAEIWALPHFSETRPRIVEHHIAQHADVAAFRLEPFDATTIARYPVLRGGHSSVKPGTNICRVGFPWHHVDATFDGESGFNVTSGFPVPTFALDGMVSRFNAQKFPDGTQTTYIETSTPGLRGQSGGPLLDTDGRVCGLQSGTAHYDLGFDATYSREGKEIVERQFLNVGRALHVDDIKVFLDSLEIAYAEG